MRTVVSAAALIVVGAAALIVALIVGVSVVEMTTVLLVLVFSHGTDDTVSCHECKTACRIRNKMDVMTDLAEIERLVRTRLRSLRTTLGLSLSELAERTNLSASTISRIETGNRAISLDVLLPLADALAVDLDSLLDVRSDDDVVIRPAPTRTGPHTSWMLSRPTSQRVALRMRLEPTKRPPEQRVHPGNDWFVVIEGKVNLRLGERELTVTTGEAAEFTTMTPHSIEALGGPAELIVVFDRDGQRAHAHD